MEDLNEHLDNFHIIDKKFPKTKLIFAVKLIISIKEGELKSICTYMQKCWSGGMLRGQLTNVKGELTVA